MVAKQHSIHYPITVANAMAASAHNPLCHCQCHGCSICRRRRLIVACCFRTFYFLMAPVANCAARAAAIPLLLFHVAVTIAMLVGNVAAIWLFLSKNLENNFTGWTVHAAMLPPLSHDSDAVTTIPSCLRLLAGTVYPKPAGWLLSLTFFYSLNTHH